MVYIRIIGFFSFLLLFSFRTIAADDINQLIGKYEHAQTAETKADYALKIADQLKYKKPNEAIEWLNEAINLAQENDLKTAEANAYRIYSQLEDRRNNYDTAINYAEKALTLYHRTTNLEAVTDMRLNMSSYLYHKGNMNQSLVYARKALKYFERKKLALNIASTANKIGIIYKNIDEYDKAIAHYYKALEIYESVPDSLGMAKVLTNIGVVYKNQKQFEKALDFHKKSLGISLSVGAESSIGDCYNNIGIVLKNQGNYEDAIKAYIKALEIWTRQENERKKSYTLNNMGVTYALQKKYDKALRIYEESREIKEKLNDKYSLASLNLNVAEIYINQGKYKNAFQELQKAQKLAYKTNSKMVRLKIYNALSKLYSETGAYKLSLDYKEKYIELKDSIFDIRKTQIIKDLEASYEAEKEERLAFEKQQEQQIEKISEEKEDLKESKKEQQFFTRRVIFISISIGFVLIIALLISIYRRYRIVKRSRSVLEATNMELKESLISIEEKEILLKEIHHRVKNNLQIITSLLRLQSENIKDDQIQIIFNETQNRIKSMALVHEELYQTKDFAKLNIVEYLEKLVDDLVRTYQMKTQVKTSLDIEPVKLGIDTLIPLGLVINEIISNSLKHGFKDQESGMILVKLSDQDGRIDLKIEDNGKGAPSDFSIDDTESLGLELVKTLVDQLDGKLDLSTVSGFAYHILFPIK